MTSRWMLLLALSLAGCVEAQDRQMAQCRLEATKELSREQITAGQHTAPVRACMLAGGYEFNDTLADCRAATEGFLSEQAACYEPTDFVGRLTHRLEVFVRRQLPY
jgi:Flp pilus assembly protein TadD